MVFDLSFAGDGSLSSNFSGIRPKTSWLCECNSAMGSKMVLGEIAKGWKVQY